MYIILSSTLGLILCFFRPFNADNTFYLSRLLSFGVLPIAGIKLKSIGVENFEKVKGSAIIISNHQNNFDVFVVGPYVPHNTVSIGKKIIRLFPFFGWIYWLSGHILIDRSKKRKAVGTMKQASEKMINKNLKVWIMPEGTRSKGRGLLPFKKGAFHMAQQTGLPIIPVIMSSYANTMDLNKLVSQKVLFKVLPPIPKESWPSEDINELKDYFYNLLKEELIKVDHELLNFDELPQ